jgi:hypothetical protein
LSFLDFCFPTDSYSTLTTYFFIECEICGDEFVAKEGLVEICDHGHSWCKDCVLGAVETAINNVSDTNCMPPRCCSTPLLYLTPPHTVNNHRGDSEVESEDDNDGGYNEDDNAAADDDDSEGLAPPAGPAANLLTPELRASWQKAHKKACELRFGSDPLDVDPIIVRMAMRYKGMDPYQFCSNCFRLTNRNQGCNHIAYVRLADGSTERE